MGGWHGWWRWSVGEVYHFGARVEKQQLLHGEMLAIKLTKKVDKNKDKFAPNEVTVEA